MSENYPTALLDSPPAPPAPPAPSSHRLWTLQARSAPYLFILPFVLLFAIFLLYPIYRSIVLSFYKSAGPRKEIFVGLANYAFLLKDQLFWLAIANTVAFTLLSLIIQIPVALGLALILNNNRVKFRGVFRFAFFTTHVVGSVFLAVLFAMVLSPRAGLLNRALASREIIIFIYACLQIALTWLTYRAIDRITPAIVRRCSCARSADVTVISLHFGTQCLIAAGLAYLLWPGMFRWPDPGILIQRTGLFAGQPIDINWLGQPNLVLPSILLASLWVSVGFGMIYFLAALQAVDKQLLEAAEVDGAGRWSKFWNVTLPCIKPVLIFMVLVNTIAGFQLFELPYVLFEGGAGPRSRGLTIVMYLFQHGFQAGNLGYAAAIGWILVLMVLAIAILQIRWMRATQEP